MANQPLAEVFGFPIDNMSAEADRHRTGKLCPYNNVVAKCTKNSQKNPLGVCSVFDGEEAAITCPVRFREDWMIAKHAADFFFPVGTTYRRLSEIRMKDAEGQSLGNIDMVLVAHDPDGTIIDYGSVEIQAVYISGNVSNPFHQYMEDPEAHQHMNWRGEPLYPHVDYLSSSRKRLAPQLISKGGVLNGWGRKMAVAIHQGFFDTLPAFHEVPKEAADLVWLVYDMPLDPTTNRYHLTLAKSVYTTFVDALKEFTVPKPGAEKDFLEHLEGKLKSKRKSRKGP